MFNCPSTEDDSLRDLPKKDLLPPLSAKNVFKTRHLHYRIDYIGIPAKQSGSDTLKQFSETGSPIRKMSYFYF